MAVMGTFMPPGNVPAQRLDCPGEIRKIAIVG
jgi:hypothetical protein